MGIEKLTEQDEIHIHWLRNSDFVQERYVEVQLPEKSKDLDWVWAVVGVPAVIIGFAISMSGWFA